MIFLNENNSGKNFKSIPDVKFDNVADCVAIDSFVTGWFSSSKNVLETVGLILLRLGYTENDDVRIYNYNKDNNSFDCLVNEKDFCNISFKNVNDYTEIVLKKLNTEYGYKCVPIKFTRGQFSTRISLDWYKTKYSNGMIFTHNLSDDNVKFRIELNNYGLEFTLRKPVDVSTRLFDDDGRYWKYRIEKEEELIKYLTSINFPVLIEDVYKEICDKYLGDISKYPELILKLFKVTNGNSKVSDLIHLRNGELELFGKTIGDKVYFLKSDDSYSCESFKTDSSVGFTMIVNGDMVNYNVSFKHSGVSEDDKILVEYDIGVAMSEIENVKKLARIMVPPKNVNGDSK